MAFVTTTTMTSSPTPELVLYDLGSTPAICFSPTVWRVRLLLNYRGIRYNTVFVEFPDIASTMKEFGLPPASSTADPAYTVPAIHHVPTNSYIMDSYAIAKFLETTYPSTKYRALPLHSEVGDEIVSKAAAALDPVFGPCLTPTEITMLSPRAQVYFRTTREKMFGCKIEELISGDKAEQIWAGAATEIQRVNAIVEKQKESSRGPFLFGKEPTFSDFVIAGALQSARAIDQGVFERTMGYPGFKGIYEACEPYMAKKD